MTKERVLLVNDKATMGGGVEAQIKWEQGYLEDRGYVVKSVGLDCGEAGELITDETVAEPDSRLLRRVANLSFSPCVYRGLRSNVRDFNPDVVHLHKSQKYPVTIALAIRGYPTVKTHHDFSTICPSAWGVKQDNLEVCECGVGAKCWRHGCRSVPVVVGYYGPHYAVQRRMERHFIDRHIAPGRTLTEYLSRFGYDVRQVPNPEPLRDAKEWTDEGYILFIGRLAEEKGIGVLLDAVTELAPEYPDLDLRIAGSGPMEEEIRRRVEHSLEDTVEILGFVSEEKKERLYRNARATVVPSVWMEAYGGVVLEAMAHGKPVIGSDRGGVAEHISHGSNGLLFPAADVSALADCIRRLVNDRELAEALGTEARRTVSEKATIEACGAQLESELQAV